MRDMRGAFVDFYRITGDRKPLMALKKHLQTLIDNGTSDQAAHKFDGSKWIPDYDKITIWSAVEVSLFDGIEDDEFEQFMWRWYDYPRYPESEHHFWVYRKKGGEDKIRLINSRSINNAQDRLAEIKALTELPEQPDDFPVVGGQWGLTLVPFGGIYAHRGEMPWKEIMYYKEDKSLGLDEGLAALVEKVDGSNKSFYVANSTNADKVVWAQSGYIREEILSVTVDGAPNTDIENNRVRLTVPAGQTIRVVLGSQDFEVDTTPPDVVQGLQIIADE
jgi:hypothetical protein